MIDRRMAMMGGIGLSLLLPSVGFASASAYQRTVAGKKDRRIEIWIWPAQRKKRGRIHFSHGAFSAPAKYARLLSAWAADGWEVLAPLHVDSTDHPDTKSYSQMQGLEARAEDLRILAIEAAGEPWIAAGHSYGALMSLFQAGVEEFPMGPRDLALKAVIALSPPGPLPGLISKEGFAKLDRPTLIQTGDKDVFPGQPPESWRTHLTAFEAPPARGSLFAYAPTGVDHYFGGIIGRPELPRPKAEVQFQTFLDISKSFARAHIKNGKAGKSAMSRWVRSGDVLLR
jgi:hypothetical protein